MTARLPHLDTLIASDRHDAPRPLRSRGAVAHIALDLEPVGVEDQGAGRKIAETSEHGAEATAQAFSAQQPDDGTEPEGWTEADAYDALDVDELDAQPDVCPVCHGQSEVLVFGSDRTEICRSCNGSGIEDDPDEDDGRCRVCWRHDEEVGGWADAGLCLDCADYGKPPDEPDPEDDPDPGDGGLGLPAACACTRFGARLCAHDQGSAGLCRCACHRDAAFGRAA